MPHLEDFEQLYSRGEYRLSPKGWKPLKIEYGYKEEGSVLSLCWRVSGTSHTFKISMHLLNHVSKGNYEKHIEEFLESFRQEYLKWLSEGLPQPWMREYHEQYKNWIQIS